MTDPISQILLLARFLCFVAVFYLALHKIAARLSKKPDSKLLWFFSVLTTPLTRPVSKWLMPGANEDQLLSGALFCYALLWLFLVVIGWFAAGAPL